MEMDNYEILFLYFFSILLYWLIQTINDVVNGMIFLGTRLYMDLTSKEERNTRPTALVVLNTRSIGAYKSVIEMVQNKEAKSLWGNQFTFLHVSLPELYRNDESFNPLKFIKETQTIIRRKRNTCTVYLTGVLLEYLRKYRGPEVSLHH